MEPKETLANQLREVATKANAEKKSTGEMLIESMLLDIRNMCMSSAQLGNMEIVVTAQSHANWLTPQREEDILTHWAKFQETLFARCGLKATYRMTRRAARPGERSDFALTITW